VRPASQFDVVDCRRAAIGERAHVMELEKVDFCATSARAFEGASGAVALPYGAPDAARDVA